MSIIDAIAASDDAIAVDPVDDPVAVDVDPIVGPIVANFVEGTVAIDFIMM